VVAHKKGSTKGAGLEVDDKLAFVIVYAVLPGGGFALSSLQNHQYQ